ADSARHRARRLSRVSLAATRRGSEALFRERRSLSARLSRPRGLDGTLSGSTAPDFLGYGGSTLISDLSARGHDFPSASDSRLYGIRVLDVPRQDPARRGVSLDDGGTRLGSPRSLGMTRSRNAIHWR